MSDLKSYFRNKHVLVTGGSSGIGLALARQLVGLDASVTLVARRMGPLEEAKETLGRLRRGAQVHLLSLDVSDEAAVLETIGAHLSEHRLDMLINNAGIARPGRFLESASEDHREQMDINYFGQVNMCRAVLPHLIDNGGGHVTNVGSLLSVMGIYGYTAYAASKFAIQGFSECLRAELKPSRVQVSVLLPPDTDTPQHAAELALLPDETKAIAGSVKMLTAETVADTCLRGMAAGRFEIVPGLDGRVSVLAQRLVPGVVRWYCDSAQRKVTARA
ncbi:SDR family oxidoreductase [Endomicrobium sp. AH-315-J14]|nr:SDR family oxidoreductase [Endomicrobium sp. AH-315-J14]